MSGLFFLRKTSKNLLITDIYINNIVFGETHDSISHKFTKEIKLKFEVSMTGELNFFHSIQIK